MKDKIRTYVAYQLRFKEEPEKSALIEEITVNLIERYEDLLNTYHDEQRAYIETINSMGDFHETETVDESFELKPSISDSLLLTSLILSIASTLLLFISALFGIILGISSITLYASVSLYIYNKSRHILKTDKDVSKHNESLKKIFKYLKTSFIFWNITISFTLSYIVYKLVLLVFTLTTNTVNQGTLRTIILVSILVFGICFAVFWKFFADLYKNLSHHYYMLTGDNEIKGFVKEAKPFIPKITIRKFLFSKITRLLLVSISYISLWTLGTSYLHIDGSSGMYGYSTSIPMYMTVLSFVVLVLIVLCLLVKNKEQSIKRISVFYGLWLLLIALIIGGHFIHINEMRVRGYELVYENISGIYIALILFITYLLIEGALVLNDKKKDTDII